MIPDDPRLRRRLVRAARRAEALDLVAYAQGNLSARIPGTEYVLITPASVPYAEMRPEDIVTVDLDGRRVHGALEPSSETPVHTLAYRTHPAVGACVHVEPPYLNALAVTGVEVPNVLGNFVYLFGGRGLAVVPCLHSGTAEFAQAAVGAMGDRFGAVWKNHGLFCVGQDIAHALNRCIAAEQAARVYYLALAARPGAIALVPAEVQEAMVETARARGWARPI